MMTISDYYSILPTIEKSSQTSFCLTLSQTWPAMGRAELIPCMENSFCMRNPEIFGANCCSESRRER